MFGALLGGAFKLIGANRARKDQARANYMNSWPGQVEQAEAAGLNPHFAISQGQYIPQQSVSVGDTFGTVGNELGRMWDEKRAEKTAEEVRQTQLRKQNHELQHELRDLKKTGQPGYMQQYGEVLPIAGGRNALSDTISSDRDVSGRVSDPNGRNVPVRERVHKYIEVWDSDIKGWVTILNPELTESGPGEMATGIATLGAAAAVQHGPSVADILPEEKVKVKKVKAPEGGTFIDREATGPFVERRPLKKYDADLQKAKDDAAAWEYHDMLRRRGKRGSNLLLVQ